jgi:hypothetical protein
MDVVSLLQKLIAQNDIIIRQNEQMFLLLAQRANSQDSELLVEMKKLNGKLSADTLPVPKAFHT